MSASDTHPSIIGTLRQMSRPVWLLLIGMVINRLGSFLQIYLVLYLTHKGFSVTGAGIALGAYGIGSVVGVLVGGAIADRIGHRWTIVGSMVVAGALTASVVHIPDLSLAVVVAAAIGITAQAYRPASSAMLVEVTPEQQHIMVFAVYRLAFNLGTVAGPLVGAVLITYSYELMFYGDALTSIAFGLLAIGLPRATGAATDAPDGAVPRQSYLAVLRDARYMLFMLALFLNAVVYIQSIGVLPLQVTASGHPPSFYAVLLSINAFVVACLELPFTKFVQRLPSRLAVAAGIGLVGVGMNLYLAGPAMAMFIVATLVWTIGEMVGTPTASAYPGQIAPKGLRARYIAASAFAMQIGYSVGPVLGVAVWAVWPAGVWWLCGVLTIVAVFVTMVGMPTPARRERTPRQVMEKSGAVTPASGSECR